MDKEELFNIKIQGLCIEAYNAAQAHWDGIAKPLDGLGAFEDIVKKIAGITGSADVGTGKKAVVVMCADNGIIDEGVSQSGNEVTSIVSANMAKGIASVCRMSHIAGADVLPVDIGIKDNIEEDGLIIKKVANGTANFAKEPAMTEDMLIKSIHTGIDIVKDCKDKGYNIIATGEMGIGNTTTSSAIVSVMLGIPASRVAGRGAGLDSEGVKRKIIVIESAIKKYGLDKGTQKQSVRNIQENTFNTLRCLGGLDIAGLTGVFIGGALYHIPVILDGLISAAAALAADRIVPGCRNYMLASHVGKEPACNFILEELGLEPVINARLALGEGTGAVLLFPMLDMALEVYRENTTFNDINVIPFLFNESI